MSWADVSASNLSDFEDAIVKYGDACVRLPKDLKEWNAYKELKQKIDELKMILPIIRDLKKESIKPRHWDRIIEITGAELNYK